MTAQSSVFPARVLLTFAMIAVCTCGCVRRDGRNSDCIWPGEPRAQVLNANDPATSRHLSADTEFAEELADRYTNVHYGPGSAYVGPPIAGRVRHECMVRIFREIGQTHGVPNELVIASFGRNRLGIDLAEILSFTVLFAWITSVVIRRIWARYPPTDGWAAGILVTVLCSVGFGVAAALVGPVWSMTIESIRVGTGHLGPRVMRLPMEHYTKIVFAAGIAMFWIVTALYFPRIVHRARQACTNPL